jgi:hypothetical protein
MELEIPAQCMAIKDRITAPKQKTDTKRIYNLSVTAYSIPAPWQVYGKRSAARARDEN